MRKFHELYGPDDESTTRMIVVDGLTKKYGDKVAVDDLSFIVQPGIVTGFLGPNGAGKSTTMRVIVGLDAATKGSATVNGKKYADHFAPMCEVGALLEAKAVHTGRTAQNHLRVLAATTGVSAKRVDDVLELVGISDVAKKRAGGFSLGMGQRLGIASALLGDPATVILDEPVNGLDPEGILWVRELLKQLAHEGRTVFVSSHLMSEMALTADHLIVVGRGKLIADMSVADFISKASSDVVLVRTPDPVRLMEIVSHAESVSAIHQPDGRIAFSGVTSEVIGDLALANNIAVHELTPKQASLEEAFMDLTRDSVEYHATTGVTP